MLAGLVEKLLISKFGEYIENLEKDKISLGVYLFFIKLI